MIIELLLSAIMGLFELVLNLLPVIPALPESFMNSISVFFDMLKSGLGIFYFFIRPSTVAIALPLAFAIVQFEHIYRGIMWIIRKIPFASIK